MKLAPTVDEIAQISPMCSDHGRERDGHDAIMAVTSRFTSQLPMRRRRCFHLHRQVDPRAAPPEIHAAGDGGVDMETSTPSRIGMMRSMPLPQMLKMTTVRMATSAISQPPVQLLMAELASVMPMQMIGPVTTGGRTA